MLAANDSTRSIIQDCIYGIPTVGIAVPISVVGYCVIEPSQDTDVSFDALSHVAEFPIIVRST